MAGFGPLPEGPPPAILRFCCAKCGLFFDRVEEENVYLRIFREIVAFVEILRRNAQYKLAIYVDFSWPESSAGRLWAVEGNQRHEGNEDDPP